MSEEELVEVIFESCEWTPGQHYVRWGLLAVAAGAIGFAVGKAVTERKYRLTIQEYKTELMDSLDKELEVIRDEEYSLPDAEGEALRPADLSPEAALALSRDNYIDEVKSYHGDPEEVDLDTFRSERDQTIEERREEERQKQAARLEEEILANQENHENGGVEIGEAVTIVVEDADPDWDWDVELALREGVKAFVLHEDEFMYNEENNTQISLTYFAEDNVLVDDGDEPIPVIDPIIGEGTLKRFGDGCSDENTVFVRNTRLNVDYEISRDPGSYRNMVLGLEHSDGGPRSRRRANEPRKAKGDWQ